jgi:bacillithiol biosynthesis cysteine-adding enzyme BshC
MSRIATVRFECIPRTSALFLDYLYDFAKVKPFFPFPYSLETYRKESLALDDLGIDHREELCRILEDQNRSLGAGSRTLENIARLRDADCYAVVTGQQVGLFTGPAYTIYKALTAIKLATHYACRGVKAVPVFWMATEDHDLAEVDHCALLDGESTIRTIRYEEVSEDQHRPAGKVQFNSSIDEVRRQFLELLPHSEYQQDIARCLEGAYQAGKTLGRSFGETLSFIFSNYGLILLDPLDPRVKQILKPFFLEALQKSQRYSQLLDDRNRQLVDRGYHVQVEVEPDSIPLFFEEGGSGRRRGLTREGQGVRLKGTDRVLSWDELRSDLTAKPWNFSSNVLLRPVAQDFLLPTFAYVAGPSELAYLAQVSPLYDDLGVRMPIIFPRASVSIVEKRFSKVLEKYHLDFCDLFQGLEWVMRNVIEKHFDQSLAGEFVQIEKDFEVRLSQLEPALRNVDPTLGEALKTAQKKIQYHVDHLRTKFINAEVKLQETMTRQVERTVAFLHPSKSLQEREINIFYFLSRYGMDLLAQLYEEIDLTDPDHRLIYV